MGYPKWVYEVYDKKDGLLLGKGTFASICDLFDEYDKQYHLFRYSVLNNNEHEYGGYWVEKRLFDPAVDSYHRGYKHTRKTTKYDREMKMAAKSESKKQKRMTKTEKLVDMVERHLTIYGNTFTNKDPKKIIPILNKHGYFVDVEYRPKHIDHYPSGAIEIWNDIWILTSKPTTNKEKTAVCGSM